MSAAPISFVIGRRRGHTSSSLQTVIFPRKRWKRAAAIAWLKRHKLKAAPLETLRGSLRATQHPTRSFTAGSLRTIHTSGHPQPLKNPRLPAKLLAALAPAARANPTVKAGPHKLVVPEREYQQAITLYRKFREKAPERITVYRLKMPRMLMAIGSVPFLYYYTTHKGGRQILYEHKFAAHARPTLASSHDGKALYLVGGEYDFTRDGIVDRPA